MTLKKAKLVTISAYAEHYNIDRKTVYRLLRDGVLTRYTDPDGNPLLSLSEKPVGVKKYGMFRKRRIV
jgi:hypothetical protein